ncbi:hypothetical protein [Pseudovibrio sp. Tun.PSC04-5.I4]|uniref:hypothetical protein n=1 Tax=Pseudovibrio sp. Tun.PSC04-5.I4 TaxID=1798213 RepID=UPI000AABFA24|nr:hypothetical protein [Pseudovibrio sp. Tun.PSC04-5.I4]
MAPIGRVLGGRNDKHSADPDFFKLSSDVVTFSAFPRKQSGSAKGSALVRPGTLLEQWKVLEACVAADKIVIMQAANT